MEVLPLPKALWFAFRPIFAFLLCTALTTLIMFAIHKFDTSLVQSGAGLLFCMMGLNIWLYYYHLPENWTKKFWGKIIAVIVGVAAGGATAMLYMQGVFSTDATPFYVFTRLLLPGYDFMLCDGNIQRSLMKHFNQNKLTRCYFRVLWYFIHEFASWAIATIIFEKLWNFVLPDDLLNFALFTLVVFVYVAGTAGKSLISRIESDFQRVCIVFVCGVFVSFAVASFFAGSLRQLFMDAVSETFIERPPDFLAADQRDWDNTVPILYVQWVKGILSFFWAIAPFTTLWKSNNWAGNVLFCLIAGPSLAWVLANGAKKYRYFHFYWHTSPTLGPAFPMIWNSPFSFAAFEFGMLIGNIGWAWILLASGYPLVWKNKIIKRVQSKITSKNDVVYDVGDANEFETTV